MFLKASLVTRTEMMGMEKGSVRPPSPGVNLAKPGMAGTCSRIGRTLLVILAFVALLGFSAWTVVLYSVKLSSLQQRVDSLEQKLQFNDENLEVNLQKYIEVNLDKLIDQVRKSMMISS